MGLEVTRLRIPTLAVVLLLAAACAEALTLGRARGAVILGRPLQITVAATLDATEPELCAQAELFQGDVRTGPLEVLIERSENQHLIRLRSTVPIEEPMITIYLRAGCGQQFTRSYVLLADQPQEVAPALALAPSLNLTLPSTSGATEPRRETPAAQPPAAALPEPGMTLRASDAMQHAAPPAASGTTRAEPAKPKPRPAAKVAQAAQREPAASRASRRPREEKAATAPVAKPRLKLEPVDIAVESAPPLKLSPQLSVSETGTRTGRAAAAAEWKVLSATPEQLAAQARRAEAMEAELKALRDAMQKNTASMTLLASQLENVRSERNLASAALATLAVLLAGGLGFLLWLRARDASREQARWQSAVSRESTMDPSRAPQPFSMSMDSQVIADDINSDWIGMSRMDHEGMEPTEHVPLATRTSRPVALGPLPEFEQSEFSQQRVLPSAEELIDIKQKADFFIALGQVGQAIDLLEAQIHDHLGSSPLVWLDLLDICQRFGRKDEYERFRAEFQAAFNARLPEFEVRRTASAGLEDHPRALSRICLLWPSARVLRVIEESLFDSPHQPSAITFDLEASRDLLLLYGIAKEVVRQPEVRDAAVPDAGTGPVGEGLASTEPVPLAALDTDEPAAADQLAPDIDLDFLTAARISGPPPTPAPPSPAPPELDAFSFDFEPKARTTT